MNAHTTLLIEIDHPSGPEPLRLMCGSDFDVLRTDATGLEIYGKAHEGEEYLLFPLEFRPLKAGVLELRIPAAYEDHCLDSGADGARIVFKAPHGRPFFAEMPEEYWSSSGVLRVDRGGTVTVELDRADPDDLADVDGPAGHGCGCGGHHHEKRAPSESATSDAQLAEDIRRVCADLNGLLRRASGAGMIVELSWDMTRSAGGEDALRIERILKTL